MLIHSIRVGVYPLVWKSFTLLQVLYPKSHRDNLNTVPEVQQLKSPMGMHSSGANEISWVATYCFGNSAYSTFLQSKISLYILYSSYCCSLLFTWSETFSTPHKFSIFLRISFTSSSVILMHIVFIQPKIIRYVLFQIGKTNYQICYCR